MKFVNQFRQRLLVLAALTFLPFSANADEVTFFNADIINWQALTGTCNNVDLPTCAANNPDPGLVGDIMVGDTPIYYGSQFTEGFDFADPAVTPTFWDAWKFTTGELGNLSVSFAPDILPSIGWSIVGLSGLVQSGNFQDIGHETQIVDFTIAGLAAGTYELIITGTINGSAGGAYNGSVALGAVPLPAAAWLFGSALMGLTLVARRRNQQAGTLAV